MKRLLLLVILLWLGGSVAQTTVAVVTPYLAQPGTQFMVAAGLQTAAAAAVPVFGMDAGSDPLLVSNVTSNAYAVASETATYVVDALEGRGNVVMFVFDFPALESPQTSA